MRVMKFGGTSIGRVEKIRRVAGLVQLAGNPRPVVILSAMCGVTDVLLAAGDSAVHGSRQQLDSRLAGIRSRHEQVTGDLFGGRPALGAVLAALEPVWEEVQEVFTGVLLLRELSSRSRDLISSFGERLIIPIFVAKLQELGVAAQGVDARQIIVTGEAPDFVQVDFDQTRARCRSIARLARDGVVPVVTGFICATPEGVTTTLGRGGSDYSASVIGYCLEAEEIQIWTDVDGVMTADPRIVPDARVLDQISYIEAAEMSYFGADVLHPKTIIPASDGTIPIRIKNTFAPEREGTLITSECRRYGYGVKTVTSITGVTLVTIEGRGMIGVPGTAGRAFTAIAGNRINVLMFSQGSSEQHISLVVSRHEGEATVRALERAFQPEIEGRRIDRIAGISDVAIIALVGEGMKGTPGIAARAFGVLGQAGINISMIAQGSSEYNLSFLVEQRAAAHAVRLIHEAFKLQQID